MPVSFELFEVQMRTTGKTCGDNGTNGCLRRRTRLSSGGPSRVSRSSRRIVGESRRSIRNPAAAGGGSRYGCSKDRRRHDTRALIYYGFPERNRFRRAIFIRIGGDLDRKQNTQYRLAIKSNKRNDTNTRIRYLWCIVRLRYSATDNIVFRVCGGDDDGTNVAD